MRRVEWRTHAIEDLFSIIEYISLDDLGAAEKIAAEIDRKVGLLTERWQQYRIGRVDGTREMVVHKNYVVVYAVLDSSVIVLRVLHASRQWPSA